MDGKSPAGATVQDVADRARVSVATVSRALRGLPNVAEPTRARVLAAAGELRYRPDPNASRLAAGRSHAIGVAVPVLGRWYFGHILAPIAAAVAPAGFDLLLYTAADPDDRRRFLDDALPMRKRVDGVVVVDIPLDDADAERWAGSGVHFVTVGQRTAAFSSVTIDEEGSAALAVRHLLDLGHRRIGLLGGQPPEATFHLPIPDARRDGHRAALEAAGVAADPALEVDGLFTVAGGQAATGRLLDGPEPPTAVFAMSDEMAWGALTAARERGLAVPGDLSVAGFDDAAGSEALGLTTVRQSVDDVGSSAARLLLAALAGDEAVQHVALPTTLEVRSTTGPPAAAVAARRRRPARR